MGEQFMEIANQEDLNAALVAFLITPLEVAENTITYDKESVMDMLSVLEWVFDSWYNTDIKDETERMRS